MEQNDDLFNPANLVIIIIPYIPELPLLSADGRIAVFSSKATNLVSGDEDEEPDVFIVPGARE